MAKEHLPTLFDSFTQIDATTTRKHGGSGLGLAICKKLCELMDGHIGAESEVKKGSCFTFSLQFDAGDIDGHVAEADNAAMFSKEHLTEPCRILLVEDNKVNQVVFEAMLKEVGLECDIAINGNEAIELLKQTSKNKPYTLIFMDCQMPELDGYQATRLIRKGQAGNEIKHIPIVALTAHALKGDKEKCLDAGMNDYLTKPLKLKALKKALMKWLV